MERETYLHLFLGTYHLSFHHLTEQSVLFFQFLRISGFCDMPVFQYYYFICVCDSTHAVCDNQYRFMLDQLRDTCLDFCLVLYVERGCGFVQQHDGSVFQ